MGIVEAGGVVSEVENFMLYLRNSGAAQWAADKIALAIRDRFGDGQLATAVSHYVHRYGAEALRWVGKNIKQAFIELVHGKKRPPQVETVEDDEPPSKRPYNPSNPPAENVNPMGPIIEEILGQGLDTGVNFGPTKRPIFGPLRPGSTKWFDSKYGVCRKFTDAEKKEYWKNRKAKQSWCKRSGYKKRYYGKYSKYGKYSRYGRYGRYKKTYKKSCSCGC